MRPSTSTNERWQFAAIVLLPVVLVLFLTAAVTLGFLLWSAYGIDQRALDREGAILAKAIENQRSHLTGQISTIAVSDDTVANTAHNFDYDWVHQNIGTRTAPHVDEDEVFLLDAADRPLYMARGGVAIDAGEEQTLAAPIKDLVDQLRTEGRPSAAGSNYVSDFAVIGGHPAIMGAMTIAPDTAAPLAPGRQPVIVSVSYLDNIAAQAMGVSYLVQNGKFITAASYSPDRASHSILNNAGMPVAYFEWDHDRPGMMMLRQTGGALIIAFIIAGVMVSLLLRQLRSSSAALEEGRMHAEFVAAHDHLTGLLNRVSFDRELAEVLQDPKHRTSSISLMMLDLDRFKQVNDTLGHQAGDQLIGAVAERLRLTIGTDTMVARLGGDEFGVLLISDERNANPLATAERIIKAISKPFDLPHFKAHVGVSVGIAISTPDNAPNELMRKADIALYEAKANGRNRAIIYEEHMNEMLQLQRLIEAEMREALQRSDQLSVAFQPLVDQQSRKVIGAEALARWNHPKYGQISPARFIPIAENTGQIEALGEFVLRRACELGASAPGRTIAVNISPTQLRNPRFANQVFDILHETGMRAADLELEITEAILLDDEHVSAQNILTFRTAGVHVALDDFGTGYSSLSYLKRYPVDRIKIDRSFVMQLEEGHVSVAITQAIVTLAHAMSIEVTAEGVETEAQATILGQLGCNTLQGYLFSSGVNRDEILAIFADKANTVMRRRRHSFG